MAIIRMVTTLADLAQVRQWCVDNGVHANIAAATAVVPDGTAIETARMRAARLRILQVPEAARPRARLLEALNALNVAHRRAFITESGIADPGVNMAALNAAIVQAVDQLAPAPAAPGAVAPAGTGAGTPPVRQWTPSRVLQWAGAVALILVVLVGIVIGGRWAYNKSANDTDSGGDELGMAIANAAHEHGDKMLERAKSTAQPTLNAIAREARLQAKEAIRESLQEASAPKDSPHTPSSQPPAAVPMPNQTRVRRAPRHQTVEAHYAASVEDTPSVRSSPSTFASLDHTIVGCLKDLGGDTPETREICNEELQRAR